MNTHEQVRSKLAHHAAQAEQTGTPPGKAVTWEIIHDMENAWRTEPVKVRTANRRACLRYLFGVDSTKQLTPWQIAAMRVWMLSSPDREAELHAVLKAALVAAGQLAIDIV